MVWFQVRKTMNNWQKMHAFYRMTFYIVIQWLFTLWFNDFLPIWLNEKQKNKKALNQQRNCYNWNSIVIKINNHSNLVAFLILFFSLIKLTELLKTLQNNFAKQSCFVMIENLLFSSLFWCPNNINN